MSTEGGLVSHTLDEQRDINDAKQIFGDVTEVKTDPEMVQLAKQLIDRQTAKYDPSDIEKRYETRLREMIDAKLKGEGIELVSERGQDDRLLFYLPRDSFREIVPAFDAARGTVLNTPRGKLLGDYMAWLERILADLQ